MDGDFLLHCQSEVTLLASGGEPGTEAQDALATSTTGQNIPAASTAISGRKAGGDKAYAQEELVAELASAFLCADLEVTMIFTAAQRAADFLHRLQPPNSRAA